MNERARRLEPRRGAGQRFFVRRVEDEQIRESGRDAVNGAQHLGTQAASTHTQQVHGAQALFPHFGRKRAKPVQVRAHHSRRIEPAEAVANRGRRRVIRSVPDGRIPFPNPADDVIADELFYEGVVRGV